MKNIKLLLMLSLLVLALSACATTQEPVEIMDLNIQNSETVVQTSDVVSVASDVVSAAPAAEISVEFDDDDLTVLDSADAATLIGLAGDVINVQGSGVVVEGTIATITSTGTYSISGTLNDGQIIVDTVDEETVVLILNGVDITCSNGAPIYVSNAAKTVITLAAGTQNHVTDGSDYVFASAEVDEPNAAVFSNDDLTINGEGSLTVMANYNNGIDSNDDLKIASGNITVFAVNDGIKANDSISVLGGNITITAGGDGMQSNNIEDPEKGFVVIENGTISITAGLDGIQAETNLQVGGGSLDIVTGGGSVSSGSVADAGSRSGPVEGNDNQTEDSIKGLKAGMDMTISGGEISISALDDALHSDSTLIINGGVIEVASGDDAVHADDALTINGGTLNVIESYEGLESQIITINDGVIHLTTSDDGINATDGGAGGVSGPGVEYGDNYVYINGGYLYINSGGDGLDSNGNYAMTGGVVLVDGPAVDYEGPLDYGASFNISGGLLVAVGSARMAQAPSADSTQYSVLQILNSVQAAGTMVHIETTSGENVLTFVPAKAYQSVVFSSPELQEGESYVIYTGGSSTGTAVDGLITDGDYTAGSQVANFTITSIVTRGEGGMLPGEGGGRPGGGNRP
jgi:hypothetical protein